MSEMMNEGVAAEEKIPALLQDAQGVVVILEVAGAELLIEKSHFVEHFPLEEKAESHERRLLLPRVRFRFIVVRGKCLHFLHTAVRSLDLLAVGAAIRDTAHRTNLRGAVKGAAQVLQPVLRDNSVAVQKQELRPFRNLQTLIASLREALVFLVVDAVKIFLLHEPPGRAVFRCVLDDNDLIRPFIRMLSYALDAELQHLQRVVAQNNDARLMTHASLS